MHGLALAFEGTHDTLSTPEMHIDPNQLERGNLDRNPAATPRRSYALTHVPEDEIELADSEQVPEAVATAGEAGRNECVEEGAVGEDGSERDLAGGGKRTGSPSPGPHKPHHAVSPSQRPSRSPSDLEANAPSPSSRESVFKKATNALKRHAAFVGPGVIASVAYLDPGNWSTDLAAGSQFGYSHLFVIFFAGMMALLFQVLSTRLGCVSDYDLATHCRFALYDRPSPYKLYYRYLLLYPLYVLAEIGIVMTDLAELLGSAIAINLLIPRIPLWACVLLTSLDVFLILLLFNQYPTRTVTRSMRLFELLIGVLVIVVLASFVAMLVKVGPVWKDVFRGYVPGSGIIGNGGIYIAVGIVGATVMPHAFYIGSKMATMRRLKPEDYGEVSPPSSRGLDSDDYDQSKELKPSSASTNTAVEPEHEEDEDSPASPRGRLASLLPSHLRPARTRSSPTRPRAYFPSIHLPQPVSLGNIGFDLGALSRARMRSRSPVQERRRPLAAGEEGEEGKTEAPMDEVAKTHRIRPRPTLACVRAHLTHASIDVAFSLVGFALVVNSCILILGAAVFYYGDGRAQGRDAGGVSDLFDAYELVKEYLGQAFAYLFAIALLAAGQSASLTVTLSGQIVSEGMIAWRTKPWKRRLITRCIGIIPSLAVAVSVGRQGIDALLVGSQVALSIVLTFVMIPLIIFTSQQSVMAIPHTPSSLPSAPSAPSPAPSPSPPLPLRTRLSRLMHTLNPLRRRSAPEGTTSFANSVAVIYLCSALWLLVGIANVYALYQVASQGV
ncbi:Manganese transporter pdt1 [Rhodotorula toruloides]|nr:Manganese transporter pdt1 [Rhodotorula toruloides]